MSCNTCITDLERVAFYKTIRVIKSCYSEEQMYAAWEMVRNFRNLYGSGWYYSHLSYEHIDHLNKLRK